VFLKLWSAAVHKRFRKKSLAKIVSGTQRMKNTLVHVCAKSAFVGWPTENRRISSCPTIIILKKYLNSVSKKCGYGNFNRWYHLHVLCVWGILRRWPACAPTAYEVVRNAESTRNFGIRSAKCKAVPQRHAGDKVERGYSLYSLLTALDVVNDQHHSPAALYPRKGPPVPIG
jgi:hypothetical protein